MYRERLRAGGREAFQRAFNVGLVPKSMKQEVYNNDMQGLRQQHSASVSSPMAYSSVPESHAMWDAPMQSNDYWHTQMEHPPMLEQPQMMSPHFTGSQDVQQMMPQFQQAWNPVPMQQPDMQPQPLPHGQLPAMPNMQVPQMHMQQQQLEGMPVVDSSPTELHRCMAIIMPEAGQFGQFPCDKNMMAAQLQAAADCQCYED